MKFERPHWVEITPIGYGCKQATLWVTGWPIPAGVVWFLAFDNEKAGTLQVLHSYTLPEWRRKGVRSAIHQAMLDSTPGALILTGSPSTESGEAWMKSQGFKKNSETSQWVLKPKGAK